MNPVRAIGRATLALVRGVGAVAIFAARGLAAPGFQPRLLADQLLRIGRRAFVSFPNFAHWRVRASLLFGGRMPVTRLLPIAWYATPNIHHVTVDDFRALVKARGIVVEECWFLSGDQRTGSGFANLFAEHAVFLLRKDR